MSITLRRGGLRVRRAGLLLAAGAAMSIFGMAGQAKAQSYYWGQAAGGSWDTTSNLWLLNNTGPLSPWNNLGNYDAVFAGFLSATRTVALTTPISAQGLTFQSFGGSFNAITSSTLTLNNLSGTDFIKIGEGVIGGTSSTATGGNSISSALVFSGNLSITNNGTFGLNELTLSGPISRATTGGSISYAGMGNSVISGAIAASVTGGVAKNGSGTLHLSGTNLFTGGVTINSGVLSVAADTGLGAAANGIAINDGGTLRFTATATSARVFTISGNGRIDLSNAATNTLTLATANQLVGNSLSTLNLTTTGGSGSSIGTLAVTAANNGFFGAIVVGAPATQLVGSAVSQRVLSTTSVNGATLALSLTGSLAGASSITLSNGGALSITQPATAVTGRLGAVPIISNSGRFRYNTSANGGTAITENMGPVTLTGLTLITGSSSAGPTAGTTLNFGTLTRNDHAVIGFKAGGATNGQFGGTPGATSTRFFFSNLTPDITNAGSPLRSVVPWAFITDSSSDFDAQNLMTYDANGFRPLNTTTEQVNLAAANTLAAAAPGVNIRPTLSSAIQTIANGGQAINSFATRVPQTIAGNATASTPGDVLTVNSGAFANWDRIILDNATLNFPNGAYFNLGFGITVQGNSRLTGSNGITVSTNTVSNSYELVLNNTPDGGNTFTGGLFIQGQAQVLFTLNNQLGNDGSGFAAGDITLGGGQLLFGPGSATTVALGDTNNRSIFVNASNGTIGSAVSGAVLQIPGVIGGAGQMQFGGGLFAAATGVVELTNPAANTYSGGTLVSAGTLRISNSNQLGSGPVLLNGGTLQASGGLAFAAAPTMVASSTIDTQGNNVALNGGLNGSAGTSLTASTALTMGLTKAGSGTLTIGGPSNFAGTVSITGGTVTISGNGAAPSLGAVTVAAGNAFNVNDSATPIANRVGQRTGVSLTGNGAQLNLTTNASGTTMSFGALSTSSGIGGAVTLADGGSGNNSITFLSLSNSGTLSFSGTTNFGGLAGSGSHIFFATSPVGSDGDPIPNVTFTGFGGSGGAAYSLSRGVILFTAPVVSGSIIDNFGTDASLPTGGPVSKFADFTVNGAATPYSATAGVAKLGASVYALTLDGANLLLRSNVAGYGPAATNANTANNTLAVINSLVSQNGAKTISLDGASPNALLTTGSINTISDLTIGTGVGLAGTVSKIGAGTLTLQSSNSTATSYSVNNGMFKLDVGGGIPVGSTVAVGSLGTFNVATGGTQSVASASGAGSISIAGGSGLTLTNTAQNFGGTLLGAGTLTYNPGAVAQMTLGGNSVGFSGAFNGNAAARWLITNPNAFGTGTVNTSAQTASSSFTTPTIGFNFGPNGAGIVPANFVLTNAGTITQYFLAQTSSNQSVTVSGLISGGNATSTLVWDESGSANNNSLILTNPLNSFTQQISVDFGTLAFTSDGALGNAANSITMNSDSGNGALRFDANNITLGAGRTITVGDVSAINTNGNDGTIAGVVAGGSATALFKIGAGKLIFSNNANTITGEIIVDEGTLQVNGSIAASANPVTVNPGARLSGSGSINRPIDVLAGGTLAPGASPGILNVGDISLVSLSTLSIEIDGNTPGNGAGFHDQANVTGTVSLGDATLELASLINYSPTLTDLIFFIVNDGVDPVTGTFAGLPIDGSIVTWGSTWSAQISYTGNSATNSISGGNDVVLYNITVPTPGAAGLLGLGGLLAARRRRR